MRNFFYNVALAGFLVVAVLFSFNTAIKLTQTSPNIQENSFQLAQVTASSQASQSTCDAQKHGATYCKIIRLCAQNKYDENFCKEVKKCELNYQISPEDNDAKKANTKLAREACLTILAQKQADEALKNPEDTKKAAVVLNELYDLGYIVPKTSALAPLIYSAYHVVYTQYAAFANKNTTAEILNKSADSLTKAIDFTLRSVNNKQVPCSLIKTSLSLIEQSLNTVMPDVAGKYSQNVQESYATLQHTHGFVRNIMGAYASDSANVKAPLDWVAEYQNNKSFVIAMKLIAFDHGLYPQDAILDKEVDSYTQQILSKLGNKPFFNLKTIRQKVQKAEEVLNSRKKSDSCNENFLDKLKVQLNQLNICTATTTAKRVKETGEVGEGVFNMCCKNKEWTGDLSWCKQAAKNQNRQTPGQPQKVDKDRCRQIANKLRNPKQLSDEDKQLKMNCINTFCSQDQNKESWCNALINQSKNQPPSGDKPCPNGTIRKQQGGPCVPKTQSDKKDECENGLKKDKEGKCVKPEPEEKPEETSTPDDSVEVNCSEVSGARVQSRNTGCSKYCASKYFFTENRDVKKYNACTKECNIKCGSESVPFKNETINIPDKYQDNLDAELKYRKCIVEGGTPESCQTKVDKWLQEQQDNSPQCDGQLINGTCIRKEQGPNSTASPQGLKQEHCYTGALVADKCFIDKESCEAYAQSRWHGFGKCKPRTKDWESWQTYVYYKDVNMICPVGTQPKKVARGRGGTSYACVKADSPDSSREITLPNTPTTPPLSSTQTPTVGAPEKGVDDKAKEKECKKRGGIMFGGDCYFEEGSDDDRKPPAQQGCPRGQQKYVINGQPKCMTVAQFQQWVIQREREKAQKALDLQKQKLKEQLQREIEKIKKAEQERQKKWQETLKKYQDKLKQSQTQKAPTQSLRPPVQQQSLQSRYTQQREEKRFYELACAINTNALNAKVGDSITLKWKVGPSLAVKEVQLTYLDQNKVPQTKKVSKEGELTFKPTQPGRYKARVSATPIYGKVCSDEIYFTIDKATTTQATSTTNTVPNLIHTPVSQTWFATPPTTQAPQSYARIYASPNPAYVGDKVKIYWQGVGNCTLKGNGVDINKQANREVEIELASFASPGHYPYSLRCGNASDRIVVTILPKQSTTPTPTVVNYQQPQVVLLNSIPQVTEQTIAQNTCPVFTKHLKKGDTHPQVKIVEEFLKRFGFFNGKPDFYFDSETKKAVEQFQQAHFEAVLAPWGLKKPTGLWYITTRSYANKLMGCTDPDFNPDLGDRLKQ